MNKTQPTCVCVLALLMYANISVAVNKNPVYTGGHVKYKRGQIVPSNTSTTNSTTTTASTTTNAGLVGMILANDFSAFADTSPWNTPIATNPALDADSALMISNLKSLAKNLTGNIKKWTIPLFVIDASQSPKKTVKITDTSSNPAVDPNLDLIAENVPLPDGIWPDQEADGHLLLVDPKLHKSWDFSHARNVNGQWQASRLDIWDLNGSGFRAPFVGKNWWTYGASGSGMPLIGGLIRLDEIKAGVINHALAFDGPINRRASTATGRDELCPPASRTDGTGIGKQYLYMGARLQLNPNLDLNKLGLSSAAKVIARAMQKYGLYNSGTTYEDFTLYFQHLGADGGAWSAYNFPDELIKIPVEEFRVLDCNLVVKPN